MKLVELLVTVAIIVVLASIGAPAVVKAGKRAKMKWYEANAWHGARLQSVLNDDTPQSTLDYYMTNNPPKYQWNIVKPN